MLSFYDLYCVIFVILYIEVKCKKRKKFYGVMVNVKVLL